ncbi:tyrosine-type recombinase/integrase [Parabacteroides goldsteinii]|uniref:tyrosine-type recombinase/integrase n=1 Tax=Parabacteroides goldsteinii TaxID=328812 RepID=UPI00259B4BF8|nr:tyrosine-type recombinase/integrase [Parabacteroides goldsteinii]
MIDKYYVPIALEYLIREVSAAMPQKFGTGKGRMKHYRHAFYAIIQGCGSDGAIYDEEKVQKFVTMTWEKYQRGTVTLARFQNIRRAAALLEDYYKTGTLEWKQLPPMKSLKKLSPSFKSILEKYKSKTKKVWAYSTWKLKAGTAERLMDYLNKKGHVDFSSVSPEDIWAYVISGSEQHRSSMGNVLADLRAFSQFLCEEEFAPTDYSRILTVSVPKKRRVIPGFSLDEGDKVVAAVDTNTPLGKRDYAILLLAQFTGMRGIDIINLRRSDIDWYSETIHITQHKTGEPFSISFEPIVGNAIADYLLNGRPASDSPYIFLKHCSPISKLNDASVQNIAKKYLQLAGIPRPATARKGIHCFRRSLGARLLEVGTPAHMISQILGQRDPDSVRSYLHMGTEKMRECAIDLAGIEVEMEELL